MLEPFNSVSSVTDSSPALLHFHKQRICPCEMGLPTSGLSRHGSDVAGSFDEGASCRHSSKASNIVGVIVRFTICSSGRRALGNTNVSRVGDVLRREEGDDGRRAVASRLSHIRLPFCQVWRLNAVAKRMVRRGGSWVLDECASQAG